MGKILVFIFDEMTDYEISFVIHLLGTEADKKIITIAYEDKIIRSHSGLLYKPECLISDVLLEDVDGLIIPGGWKCLCSIATSSVDLLTLLFSKLDHPLFYTKNRLLY